VPCCHRALSAGGFRTTHRHILRYQSALPMASRSAVRSNGHGIGSSQRHPASRQAHMVTLLRTRLSALVRLRLRQKVRAAVSHRHLGRLPNLRGSTLRVPTAKQHLSGKLHSGKAPAEIRRPAINSIAISTEAIPHVGTNISPLAPASTAPRSSPITAFTR
jgi:hypothetical protein